MIEFERTQIQHFRGHHGIFNLLLFFERKERKLATNKHIKQHNTYPPNSPFLAPSPLCRCATERERPELDSASTIQHNTLFKR